MVDHHRFNEVPTLFKACIDLIDEPNIAYGFRGQANANFPLKPTIDRHIVQTIPYETRLEEERQMVAAFKAEAINFLGVIEVGYLQIPGDVTTNSLAVLQHYGAPTRLLDWSYSPFVAIYFACIHEPTRDGAVVWFPRGPADREHTLDHAADAAWKDHGCYRESDGSINPNVHAFRVDSPAWMCGVDYGLPFERMQKQQGFFTMSGRLGVEHGEKLDEMIPGKVTRWIIPALLKKRVISQLRKMNINGDTIGYGGADHVGRALGEKMKVARL